MLYILALTGGYEQPSYEGFTDLDQAIAKMRETAQDIGASNIESGETSIDLLSINPVDGKMANIGGTIVDAEAEDASVVLVIPGVGSEVLSS